MKLLTGLFRAARKRLMTTDNDMGMFRDKLMEIVTQKDSLSDDEITAKVEELKSMTNDLPDSDDKAKLVRFLEDFKEVKGQDVKVAEEAAKQVADQFEKLDTEAMADVPGAVETEEEVLTEGEAPEEAPAEGTEVAEEAAEETEAEDGVEEGEVEGAREPPEDEIVNEVNDDDETNAEYTLEEIYQYCKKRKAEDDAAEANEVTEEEDEEVAEDGELQNLGQMARGEETPEDESDETKDGCDKDEITTDNAPRIPVTVNKGESGGSLGSLFELAKRG